MMEGYWRKENLNLQYRLGLLEYRKALWTQPNQFAGPTLSILFDEVSFVEGLAGPAVDLGSAV